MTTSPSRTTSATSHPGGHHHAGGCPPHRTGRCASEWGVFNRHFWGEFIRQRQFTRECLAIRVARRLKSADVIDALADLFIMRGIPGHIRSDNGPEFVATAVKDWIKGVGAKAAFIEPGSPWENGYVESFNGKRRDELLA